METVHLLISGKVQGVFFRATAKNIAQKLKVTGWIKNTPKGEVEALITGERDAVKEFFTWCKSGPERAVVENVVLTRKSQTPFESFCIIRH